MKILAELSFVPYLQKILNSGPHYVSIIVLYLVKEKFPTLNNAKN